MGVEPTITAWEAVVLPLHYGRASWKSGGAFSSSTNLRFHFTPKSGERKALFPSPRSFSSKF